MEIFVPVVGTLAFLAPLFFYGYLLYNLKHKTGSIGWLNWFFISIFIVQLLTILSLIISCEVLHIFSHFCDGGGSKIPGALFGLGIIWGAVIMPLSFILFISCLFYSFIKFKKYEGK